MAQSTEAACLLQTGAMYPARIGLRNERGEDIFFGIKPGGFSLYFGDQPIYHFDLEGRWQRALFEGIHYLKRLDTSVRAIDREREGSGLVLRRRVLGPAEVGEIDERIRRSVRDLIDDIDANRLEAISPPSTIRPVNLGELSGYLGRVSRWDAAAWRAHRGRYEAIYGPWPFLPPDCPSPIVLQATKGPAFGRPPAPSGPARSTREFEDHALDVAQFLGRGASQCRDVFLAGADALRQPTALVLGYLEAIRTRFSDFLGPPGAESARAGTIHAFLDDFGPPLPDEEGWKSLKAARLGRLTLGIESGSLATRRIFGKDWTDDALRKLVGDLKQAAIGVGLVVLVGAGGRSLAAADLEATAALIGSLPLSRGDLIYLIDARSLGLIPGVSEPLSDEETAAHLASLRERRTADGASKGPKVILYNPDKQWA